MKLIEQLKQSRCYPHPTRRIEVIETHISWVILTGDYAYKIKKPVKFPFLDFSTLEKRKYYCEQELRLNQRLARDIYLKVIAITGSADDPQWDGPGPVFEYALQMRQFPHHMQLDLLLRFGKLRHKHVVSAAEAVADFHSRVEKATADDDYGNPEKIRGPVAENFQIILQSLGDEPIRSRLDAIEQWTRHWFDDHRALLAQRKKTGFVRECHGDMHLGNMAWVNENVLIFDCIEFNEDFRWIDVISDLAFVVMDLEHLRQPVFANLLLNRYLELSGDYQGVVLLPYYLCYRAMVRAKVAALRMRQPELAEGEKQQLQEDLYRHIHLAGGYAGRGQGSMVIMHGWSGSGKSWVSRRCAGWMQAVRISSDVERKRMFGFQALQKTASTYAKGIYSDQASEDLYRLLLQWSGMIINAGFSVIVDAAFLKQSQRALFMHHCRANSIELHIVFCNPPVDVIEKRLLRREKNNTAISEAGLEVFRRQYSHTDALTEQERALTIEVIDSGNFGQEDFNRALRKNKNTN